MPEDPPLSPREVQRPRGAAWALGCVFVALAALYLWVASPESWLFSRNPSADKEYYNLLVQGFGSGKLSLNIQVPEALRALKDPYDPLQNGPFRLHDASYYQGAYYLYFGVTPAITLFWPYHGLTGGYLSQSEACALYVILALGAALFVLGSLAHNLPKALPAWKLVAAALCLGLCTMVPSLLSRIAIYEVAVAACLALLNLAVACVFLAFYGKRRLAWLSLASAFMGLAIGARPSCAFGALMLLIPAYSLWRERDPRAAKTATAGRVLAAVCLPLGFLVSCLMAYNYARFGDPLEFGMRYQLAGVEVKNVRTFSLSYFWYNARVCLFEPARFSIYFPYVRTIDAPAYPDGYLGIEDPHGILTNIPVLLLAMGSLWAGRLERRMPLFCWAVASLLAGVGTVNLLFCGATNRYLPEIAYPMAFLAVVGALALTSGTRSRLGVLMQRAWLGLLVFSAAFNLLAAFSHENLLQERHPTTYSWLARTLNWPSYAVRRVSGAQYGPIALRLTFPEGRTGAYEPLLVSGIGARSDYIYVHYATPSSIIYGFVHTDHGGPSTEPIAIDYRKPHVMTVEAGFLYPPEDDPYCLRAAPEAAKRRRQHLRVTLDGVAYLDAPVEVFDPIRLEPMFGTGGHERTALGDSFSGTIVDHHLAAPKELETVHAVRPGPLRLVVRMPPFTGTRNEPLLCTGVSGKADLLYVTYVDPTHISVGLDHWGFGGPRSSPIEVSYRVFQTVDISLGSLYSGPPPASGSESPGRRLVVLWNGAVALDSTQEFYPSSPDQVQVGTNRVGASTTGPDFTGEILASQPLDPLSPAANRHP